MQIYCHPIYKYLIFAVSVFLTITNVIDLGLDNQNALTLSLFCVFIYFIIDNITYSPLMIPVMITKQSTDSENKGSEEPFSSDFSEKEELKPRIKIPSDKRRKIREHEQHIDHSTNYQYPNSIKSDNFNSTSPLYNNDQNDIRYRQGIPDPTESYMDKPYSNDDSDQHMTFRASMSGN